MEGKKLKIGEQVFDLKWDFFICPSHGLFVPRCFSQDWTTDDGCPVPTYREEPCGETLTAVYLDNLGIVAEPAPSGDSIREKLLGDDDAIRVYRRMKAAAEGARAERDIVREAVEGVAEFSVDMLERDGEPKAAEMVRIAHAALDADRERREANLAALQGDQEGSGQGRVADVRKAVQMLRYAAKSIDGQFDGFASSLRELADELAGEGSGQESCQAPDQAKGKREYMGAEVFDDLDQEVI